MLLKLNFLVLFLSILFLLKINSTNKILLKRCSILLSSINLIISILLFICFDLNEEALQFFFSLPFLSGFTFLDVNFHFGLDGLSILFFLLTSFLIFLCIIFIQNEKFLKEYIVLLFIIQFMLLIIFTTFDLFIFYVYLFVSVLKYIFF